MRHFLLFVTILLAAIPSFAQTMQITPDSGAETASVAVTIVGVGTHFTANGRVSELNAFLERSGNTYAGASYASLKNDSTISASFILGSPASMPVGYYDLVVNVTDTALHIFRQDSAFYVTPAP